MILNFRSAQDLLPQEYRHLSRDVFRDGFLFAAGVRLRQPAGAT